VFRKILIANRGEIAVRILRACRELGIKTVAVYSEADRESMHLRLADEAVCIGPYQTRESYLDQERILSAAKITGAQAIHPGYGFLAENGAFAKLCRDRGVAFIGPTPEAISALGHKIAAKKLAEKAGVPVVPGAIGEPKALLKASARVGFPVMVKAASGGGGKGLRLVRDPKLLASELEKAGAESLAFKSKKIPFDVILTPFPMTVGDAVVEDFASTAGSLDKELPKTSCSI